MVFTRCPSSELQFGALRQVGGTREAGWQYRGKPGKALQHTKTYRGMLYRASKRTRFGEGGGHLGRRRARGVLNPRREQGGF